MNYFEAAAYLYKEGGGTSIPSQSKSRQSAMGGKFKLCSQEGVLLAEYSIAKEVLPLIAKTSERSSQIPSRSSEIEKSLVRANASVLNELLGPVSEHREEFLFVRFDFVGRGRTQELNLLDINGYRLITWGKELTDPLRGKWTLSRLLDEIGMRGWSLLTHQTEQSSGGQGAAGLGAVTFHYMTFRKHRSHV
jgi:hypothetical protein